MSEQALDLRASLAVLRRQRRLLAGAAAVGALAGVGLVMLRPPMYTSHSTVLLPPARNDNGQQVGRDGQTEVLISRSATVLGPAGEAMSPNLSVREVRDRVQVRAKTGDILQFTARGREEADAVRLANALAQSEIDYMDKAASANQDAQGVALDRRLGALRSRLAAVNDQMTATKARQSSLPAGSEGAVGAANALAQLTAQQADLALQVDVLEEQLSLAGAKDDVTATATVIEGATTASRPGLVSRLVIVGVGGLLAALLVVATALIVFTRRDRRLRFRDEIADALGVPVTASVQSHPARSVAGWARLLETYEPGTQDAWALRQALRTLVLPEGVSPDLPRDGATGRVVTVITLSEDQSALAIGPQLASYAAACGIRTRLVAGQRHESAAALWAACLRGHAQEEMRPGLFVDTGSASGHDVQLTVVMAVVDRRRPHLAGPLWGEGERLVFGVSSGFAEAEEIARAAISVDDAGGQILGVVVSDPDDLDRTTGRMLQVERSQVVSLPTRLAGVPHATGATQPSRRPGSAARAGSTAPAARPGTNKRGSRR